MINSLPLWQAPLFLLIFIRITAFFLIMPLFSYRTIPMSFKIGSSFFIALIMTASFDFIDVTMNASYIFLVLKEIVTGLAIGFIAYIILSALQIAGGFIDFQMGFAIANVIDPQTGAQSPLMGQYFYTISMLFLLAVDGHHLLIDGMYHSFVLIPPDSAITFGIEAFPSFIINVFSQMFMIAFQIAIPIVGCLFLVDVALGMIARTVPQLNVFVVGLPVKILVSFIAIFAFLAVYINLTKRLFHYMFETMEEMMQLLGGG